MKIMRCLVIVNGEQIVSPLSLFEPQRGVEMQKVQIWKNQCISIDQTRGKILKIGSWKDVKISKSQILDAKGTVILPGFVDCHTHPIYSGSRVDEFLLRASGKPYLEILKDGGGILKTVEETRKSSDQELFNKTAKIFWNMLRHGTTTVEAKTGYGLSEKDEIRQLKILKQLKKKLPLDIFSTFLGAHAVPKEYSKKPNLYVKLLTENILPAVAQKKLADFCDVFCEKGVFSIAQSKKILEKAKELGIKLRLHGDEFEPSGGTKLGVSLNALSVDHLMGITEKEIALLSNSKTTAVLLPCTSFFLGKEIYAPARALIDKGGIVALATDFNAGSNLCFSMQMAGSLGVLKLKMRPEEALNAATLHPAYALGASHRIGSLHPGKQADLTLLEGRDFREIFYYFGTNQVKQIIKKGRIIKHDGF
jgi:imidazolonepropionase